VTLDELREAAIEQRVRLATPSTISVEDRAALGGADQDLAALMRWTNRIEPTSSGTHPMLSGRWNRGRFTAR
jgi:hypothetical protein